MIRLIAVAYLIAMTVGVCIADKVKAATPERPNILFVLMDDLGWSDVGCYGSKWIQTPNIDRLAVQGMRFTDAYTPAPVCTPTRACIISGQMSPRHGIYTVSPKDNMVAEKLAYQRLQDKQPLVGVVNQHRLPQEVTCLPEILYEAGYETGYVGKWHHEPLPADVGFKHVLRAERRRDDPKQMNALTDAAIGFMREHRDKPWFFYLSHHAPHVGNQSHAATLAKYQASLPADCPVKASYAAMVEDADTSIGRLLQVLDELKLSANTMVVLYSDNGPFLNNTAAAPLRMGKGTFYEGGIRVPLIVRWPNVTPAGATCSTAVIGTDLLPTFSEVVGGAVPGDQACDGVSLLPLLRNPRGTLARDALHWHLPHYNLSYKQKPCSVIRHKNHKLIHFYEDDRDELYDLEVDPGESNDLSKTQRALAQSLRASLDKWLTEVNAPLPTRRKDAATKFTEGRAPNAIYFHPPAKSGRVKVDAIGREPSGFATPDGLRRSANAVTLPQRRPNIVLVMADDLGYECVGANGGQSYPTPHLDRLASEGVRFQHCYSQPLCTPTRVQIMTGLYNYRNYTRFSELSSDQQTLGHFMKSAGYRTCLAHKWQLGKHKPDHFGFDEYAIHRPSLSHWGMNVTRNGTDLELSAEQYGPDYFTDFVRDFMGRHREEPFFVYFPIWLTHEPFDATPDSADPDGRKDRKHFGDMVTYLDKIMGRITARLDELGIRENTLLIFTGDNGTVQGIETMTDKGKIIGGKSKLTDAGTHVPLIVSWPGQLKAGTVSNALVDMTDFVPTIADAGRVTLPSNIPFDGRSFLPQARDEVASQREWVLLTSDPRKPDPEAPPGKRKTAPTKGGKPTWCVRDQRWKLYNDGRLFDIELDPLEQAPVTSDSSNEATLARKRLTLVLDGLPRLDALESSGRVPGKNGNPVRKAAGSKQ
jgi:arylsulfatase A